MLRPRIRKAPDGHNSEIKSHAMQHLYLSKSLGGMDHTGFGGHGRRDAHDKDIINGCRKRWSVSAGIT
jgi:hypothetical protein